MPIVRIGARLVYFAHVPKCAGSSVEDYLRERFGPLGFLDRQYLSLPQDEQWSQSSPQHIDWVAATRLFPEGFFDASFAVVRHPVARIVSAYHFQVEVEQASQPTGFSDWLKYNLALQDQQPYLMDGHMRPQTEFIPPDCQIFHLEHGLDALIPYFDDLAGDNAAPRAMSHSNTRKKSKGPSTAETSLSNDDMALIAKTYAADFSRFGYNPEDRQPDIPKPVLDPAFIAENAAARAHAANPFYRFGAKLRRRLRNL